MSNTNFARGLSFVKDESGRRPAKTCTVLLPCPRSFTGNCPYLIHTWSCEQCKTQLKYGYDKYFYCDCGKAPGNTFRFKCCSPRHQEAFETFPEKDLNFLLARMKVLKEINILVLGETGVGKSTWINAVANYMSFATFEEAESGKPAFVIPSVENIRYKGKQIKIIIGDESDAKELEQQENGHSVTQYPASYIFRYNDLSVRLIDTPGIGDTRGLETDKENFQNILDYISHFDELHGICILLPPNQARLTPSFKFCIQELLRQLHRDACKNIMFCFTRSRINDYNPGSTVDILKALFAEIADAKIPLTRNTLYCMDSESIPFLFAVKGGNTFDSKVRDSRKNSWEMSVNETGRLLEAISKMKPHLLKNTISLNECRRVILALCTGPLVGIATSIQINVQQLQKMDSELKCGEMTEDDLRKKHNMPPVYYKLVPLKRPRVVCSSDACSRSMHITVQDNVEMLQYDQVCCEECRAPILRMCESFRLKSKCKVCSCSISYHTLMTYDVVHTHSTETATTQNKVASVLETEQKEYKYIVEVVAKFMHFLNENSVTSQADVFVDNISRQIELEGKLTARRKKEGMEDRVGILRRLLGEYQSVRQVLIASGDLREISSDTVRMLAEKLYKLERNGQRLKSAVDIVAKSTEELVKHGDTICIPDLEMSNPRLLNPVQRLIWKAPAGVPSLPSKPR